MLGNKTVSALSLIALLTPMTSFAANEHHDHEMEEVVVTSPFQKTAAETATPVVTLSGERLLENTSNNLGETLKSEIGMSSASFGPSLGHPIIRGQSGNRVSVLQNGVGVTDASNQSADHAEGVEPALAERIEVIRGPATLLYGSGAIGGVVNVIDRRVPTTVPDRPNLLIQQTYNDNNSEDKTLFRLDAGTGNFAFHLDGYRRDNDNVEIDGFSIDEFAVEALEELIHGDEDHDEDEEEELENSRGFVANSDSDAEGGSIGASFVGTRGFIGLSVSRLQNNYGLPAGSHSHGHHEHEEGEDEDEADEEEEEVEFVRIDLEKTRYDLRGSLDFDSGLIENASAWISGTDYEHDEVEFFEAGGEEVGTVYSNEGYEGRFTFTRRSTGDWSGVYGMQFSNTEFSAVGEEAFIPESDIDNLGIFGVERWDVEPFVIELGVRLDNNDVDTGGCSASESAFSTGASVLYDQSERSSWIFGLSRSERTPTVEELYSNIDNGTCQQFADPEDLVLHAATNLLEIGNPNLGTETANNLEVGYRLDFGRTTGELSVYYNQVDDYVFLNITGEEFEDQSIARYASENARFRGIEGKLTVNLVERENFGVHWGIFGDLVRARFDQGGDIPRIPAAKLGTELEFYGNQWAIHLHASRVMEQDDVANLELPTDGYNLLSFSADYHWPLANESEIKIFLRGENLLDEEIRNHASFVKNFAPESGRAFVLGLRFTY